jgi:hypothetical protein
MHADDERFLVVAAIENADAPAFRHAFHATPQVIVVEVFGGWRLEGEDFAALRVDPGHDVFDGAVLPCRIHGLKDEQHRPAILRVEHVLQRRQRFDASGEQLLGARLVFGPIAERVTGIDVLEAEVAVGDAEGFRKLARPLDELLDFHHCTSCGTLPVVGRSFQEPLTS